MVFTKLNNSQRVESEGFQRVVSYKQEKTPFSMENGVFWCLKVESNHRQRDFQSLALPTELSRQKNGDPERARTVDLQRDRLAL